MQTDLDVKAPPFWGTHVKDAWSQLYGSAGVGTGVGAGVGAVQWAMQADFDVYVPGTFGLHV